MCEYKNLDNECVLGLWNEQKECYPECDLKECPEKQIQVEEVKKKDYGIIMFGKFKGDSWESLPNHYLEYLISDECNTSEVNKHIAKEVKKQKNLIKGQLQWEIK